MTDLRHTQGRVAQQIGRVPDPKADQITIGGHAVALLEDAGEIEGGQRGGTGDRVHIQILCEVGLEIGADLFGVFADVPTLVASVAEESEQGRPPLSCNSVRTGWLRRSCGFLPTPGPSLGSEPRRLA